MNTALASVTAVIAAPPPWLQPHASLLQRILRNSQRESVAAALNAACGALEGIPRFVEPSALPKGEPYESFIARTAGVPTRDDLHDLFNGLMWLAYPRTKRRLNELQAREIAQMGIANRRGALRDALTLFDENAALLRAPASLVDALQRRDWKGAFLEQRPLWQSAQLVVFGHALLEKLMQPRKGIAAHVWLVHDLADEAIASTLVPERLISKPFLPLPVLGIPGWCSANEDPQFYDDASVFRPTS